MVPTFSRPPSDPDFFRDPYPAYREMRVLGDLFEWAEYGHVMSARFDVVNAVLRDRRFGREILHVATRAELGWPEPAAHAKPFHDFETNSMLEREPPAHTRLRALVNRAFVARTVERLRPAIARLASDLIDRFAARGAADLIAEYATPIPVAVICDLLGVPVADADRLLDWSHRMVAMYQFGRTEAVERNAVAATLAFSDYMRETIAARRARPGEDLLSGLIAARDAGERLSEDELVTTAILLLNAGHEATVHAIGNGIRLILSEGGDPNRWFADEAATERTVEEALRFDPPLHLFTRYALEDLEFCGRRFRKGETIGCLLAAANRDGVRFPDPDRFDPTRSVQANLSFGAGIHFCVGAPLARLELQVALPMLFRRLPGLRLREPEPAWRDAYHFRGLERLDVRFSASSP